MHIFIHISPSCASVDPNFQAASSTRSFQEIKDLTISHVESLGKLSGEEFTIEVLTLLEKLVKFRTFTSAAELQAVVRPVLYCLDDRRPFDLGGDITVMRSNRKSSGKFKAARKLLDWQIGRPEIISPFERRPDGCIDYDPRFFKKALNFLESVKFMFVIIVLALLTAIGALYTTVTHIEPAWLYALDIAVIFFFACEISLRLLCHMLSLRCLPGSFRSFWNVYRSIDFTCVLLDILLFIIYAGITNTSNLTKLARLIRLIRIFREVKEGSMHRPSSTVFLIRVLKGGSDIEGGEHDDQNCADAENRRFGGLQDIVPLR